MSWAYFEYFAFISIILWIVAMAFYIPRRPKFHRAGTVLVVIGLLVFGAFITKLWINLERPPMRTLGETRLWYSFFLAGVGIVTYSRWKYRWFMSYSLIMAVVFVLINYLKPETHSKVLMPALQSPWFVPHVIVYMLAYALLAAATLIAIRGLYLNSKNKLNDKILWIGDNLVYIGFAFLTFGLLFGALWAKEAWGHYWTWDPKETWSFLTWLVYLLFIHYRYFYPNKKKNALWLLSLAFVILLLCWFGINALPTAQNSVHTYG